MSVSWTKDQRHLISISLVQGPKEFLCEKKTSTTCISSGDLVAGFLKLTAQDSHINSPTDYEM